MKINLIEYFEESLQHCPDKIAVIEKDKQITFCELGVKSKQIATALIECIGEINRPVAIYLPKSIDAVSSDIACIYSGNMYMNLDVKTPLERIRNILDLIKPVVIISNNQYLKNINQVISGPIKILNLDQLDWSKDPWDEQIRSVWRDLIDTDPLCIINTSGSTGTPKGVVLNHRSFFDFTEWAYG